MIKKTLLSKGLYRIVIITLVGVFIFSGLINPEINKSVQASPLSVLSLLKFDGQISHATIGVGTVSTITYQITNENNEDVTNIFMETVLPVGVITMDPVNISSSCTQFSVSALDSKAGIVISSDFIERGQVCTIRFDITSSPAATYQIFFGNLSSSVGITDTGFASLEVSSAYPRFTMGFSPDQVLINETSTLTYSFQNINANIIYFLNFTNTLPSGVVIADYPNFNSNCNADYTYEPLGNTFMMTKYFIYDSTFSECSVSFDVKIIGSESNYVNSALLNLPGYQVKATAGLDLITNDMLGFFTTLDSLGVSPGEPKDITYYITNYGRDLVMTNIQFEHDFSLVIPETTILGLPLYDICGLGSSLTSEETGKLTLSNGWLNPGESCQIPIRLQIPDTAPHEFYQIKSSPIQGIIGDQLILGVGAVVSFYVEDLPKFTTHFSSEFSPIFEGDDVYLTYKIENISDLFSITNGQFTENFFDSLGLTTQVLQYPANGYCGTGSSVSNNWPSLTFYNLSIQANQTCEFTIKLRVTGLESGNYTNNTSKLEYVINETNLSIDPESVSLEIYSKPLQINREFKDENILPGEVVEVIYNLSNIRNNEGIEPLDATQIVFDDIFSNIYPGIVISNTPLPDNNCGVISSVIGDAELSFSGGNLNAGDFCSFSVFVEIPHDIAPGQYGKTNLPIYTYDVLQRQLSGEFSSEALDIGGINLVLSLNEFSAFPSDIVELNFSLSNHSTYPLTSGTFQFNPNDWVPGLVLSDLPSSGFCGAGSSIYKSSSNYIVSGISLDGLSSCSFFVKLTIPVTTIPESYSIAVSAFSFMINGGVQTYAADPLMFTVNKLFEFSKQFLPDIVYPGDLIGLRYTIKNFHHTSSIEEINFVDNFDDALSGLQVIDLPQSDICGVGSLMTGSSSLTLIDGLVPPESECVFDVTLQLPPTEPYLSEVISYSSDINAVFSGNNINISPVYDHFSISTITININTIPTIAGGNTVITYTIENLGADIDSFGFVQDLSSLLPGTMFELIETDNVCGTESILVGGKTLILTNGSLLSGETCTFSVNLILPSDLSPGIYNIETPLIRIADFEYKPDVISGFLQVLYSYRFPIVFNLSNPNP